MDYKIKYLKYKKKYLNLKKISGGDIFDKGLKVGDRVKIIYDGFEGDILEQRIDGTYTICNKNVCKVGLRKENIKKNNSIFSKCGEMSKKCYQEGDAVLYNGNPVIILKFDKFDKTYHVRNEDGYVIEGVKNSEINYYGDLYNYRFNQEENTNIFDLGSSLLDLGSDMLKQIANKERR